MQLNLDRADVLHLQHEAVKGRIVFQTATVAVSVLNALEAIWPLKRGYRGVSPALTRRKNAPKALSSLRSVCCKLLAFSIRPSKRCASHGNKAIGSAHAALPSLRSGSMP